MGKVVTGAVAVIKDADGKQRYFYQGSTLPDELPKDEVQRLVEVGLVGDDKELEAKPEAASGQASSDATRQETAAGERRDGRPSVSASKAEWVDYAVAHRAEGTSEEDARAEAESMTKAELVARHGGSQG